MDFLKHDFQQPANSTLLSGKATPLRTFTIKHSHGSVVLSLRNVLNYLNVVDPVITVVQNKCSLKTELSTSHPAAKTSSRLMSGTKSSKHATKWKEIRLPAKAESVCALVAGLGHEFSSPEIYSAKYSTVSQTLQQPETTVSILSRKVVLSQEEPESQLCTKAVPSQAHSAGADTQAEAVW